MAKNLPAPLLEDRVIKSALVDWHTFQFIQRPDLKEFTRERRQKLRASILINAFVESFKVWQNGKTLFCLDGFHRCLVLKELEEEGIGVPKKFRADFIRCKDRKDAASLIPVYSSDYARMTEAGFRTFIRQEGIDFAKIGNHIDIPNIDTEKMIASLGSTSVKNPGNGAEVEFTEELHESHNYVVLYFSNDIDWLYLQSLFPLSTVKALASKDGYDKRGIGRVVDGVSFLRAVTGGSDR